MIFVDTSVWVAFFRGQARESQALKHLLDDDQVALAAPVWLEILSGAGPSSLAKLRRTLTALPVIYPSRDTWKMVEGWAMRASVRGERFGVGDLLIGAIAAERGGAVWSLDADFSRMARMRFVKAVHPRPPH